MKLKQKYFKMSKINIFDNLQTYNIRIELRSTRKKLFLECINKNDSISIEGYKITKNKSKNIYEFNFHTWQFKKVYTLFDRYELSENLYWRVALMDNFYPPNFYQSNQLELINFNNEIKTKLW